MLNVGATNMLSHSKLAVLYREAGANEIGKIADVVLGAADID